MRILVLSNVGTGLYKFRKELLESLIREGNEVYISLPRDNYAAMLEGIGCRLIETRVDRRGTSPVKDLKLLFLYIRTLKRIRPDIVLTYTIKPNVYGGIACRIIKVPYIANITGLGTSIEKKGIIQKIALGLYKAGLKKASCVFFQNEPNMRFFIEKNIAGSKSRLIPGSGVNLEHYKYEEYPEDNGMIRLLYIGRIMKAKGIDELLQAAGRVKEIHRGVRFDLLGRLEEDYSEQLAELCDKGIIRYYGQQDDVRPYIKRSHATVLPTYHEGMANGLLESAAMGRPVIASRVTGCVETFDEGVSGLGFDVKSVESLVEAIIRFIRLPYEKKKSMGIEGRGKMEREFDRSIVVDAYREEINEVLKSGETEAILERIYR